MGIAACLCSRLGRHGELASLGRICWQRALVRVGRYDEKAYTDHIDNDEWFHVETEDAQRHGVSASVIVDIPVALSMII